MLRERQEGRPRRGRALAVRVDAEPSVALGSRGWRGGLRLSSIRVRTSFLPERLRRRRRDPVDQPFPGAQQEIGELGGGRPDRPLGPGWRAPGERRGPPLYRRAEGFAEAWNLLPVRGSGRRRHGATARGRNVLPLLGNPSLARGKRSREGGVLPGRKIHSACCYVNA